MSLTVDAELRAGVFRLSAAFTAGPGVTVLSGQSGAGKSTLLAAIAGLRAPAGGRIGFGDQVWSDAATGAFLPPADRGIGMVFQTPRLFPHMSVRANLIYGMDPRADPAHLAEVAALLEIDALLSRRPASLSGGEAQRVAIGRALLRRAPLLILDEPLSGLDGARKGRILTHLRDLGDAGTVILYVTHDADEIAALGAQVVPVGDGRAGA